MREYCISNDGILQSNLIEISHIKYAFDTEEHTHDAIEFVYILSGKGEHIIDGRKEKVSRGSLVVIDCGQVHSFSVTENTEYFNLLLKPEFIDKSLKSKSKLRDVLKCWDYEFDGSEYTNIHFQNGDDDKIEEILTSVLKEGISQKYGYLNVVRAYVELLIHNIVRNLKEYHIGTISKKNIQIDEAIQYIQDNCGLQLTLMDVSRKYNFSPNYFSELLKQNTGLSFKQFLIEKRMMKAIRMLLSNDEDYSVETVINECGYANKSFFYNTFKQHFGVMPKDIKRYRDGHEEYVREKFFGVIEHKQNNTKI